MNDTTFYLYRIEINNQFGHLKSKRAIAREGYFDLFATILWVKEWHSNSFKAAQNIKKNPCRTSISNPSSSL